jgi:hypothetical protein
MSSGVGHWIINNLGTVIAAGALLVTIVFWLIDHRRKRRLITYRTHMNEPIRADSKRVMQNPRVLVANGSLAGMYRELATRRAR